VETALAIVLDDAEPFDAVRRDFAVETFELGIPFHVTLLYPFAPREELSDQLVRDVGAFFAEWPPLEFALVRIAAWPDVVYAAPEPDAELRKLMGALFARFPQWPPYGGIHEEVIPHATLGEEVDAERVRPGVARRLAPHLPHRCQAQDVSLLEEYEPRRWRERERFPLAGTAKAGA
jgi:2'-5' RNA ligase